MQMVFFGASGLLALFKLYLAVLQILMPWSVPIHAWISYSGLSATSVWLSELFGVFCLLALMPLVGSSERTQRGFVLINSLLFLCVTVWVVYLHVSLEGGADLIDWVFGSLTILWFSGLQLFVSCGILYARRSSSDIDHQITSLHGLTYRYKRL